MLRLEYIFRFQSFFIQRVVKDSCQVLKRVESGIWNAASMSMCQVGGTAIFFRKFFGLSGDFWE